MVRLYAMAEKSIIYRAEKAGSRTYPFVQNTVFTHFENIIEKILKKPAGSVVLNRIELRETQSLFCLCKDRANMTIRKHVILKLRLQFNTIHMHFCFRMIIIISPAFIYKLSYTYHKCSIPIG